MAKVEIMSPVDVAWLSMEEPTNLMMVNAVIAFDRPLDVERVRQVLRYRWLRYRRFRQRVVQPRLPLLRPYWEDDPHFDLELHLQRAALPAPGDKAALQDMMSDIISTPLDRSRPLWQYHLLEGYGGGSVVACRMHHSIADGIALMRVLLSMTDLTPDAPQPPGPGEEANHDKERGLLETLVSPATSLARTTVRNTSNLASFALHQSMETLRDPWRLVDVARLGAGGAARAVIYALAKAGAAEIAIVNRTPARAQELARDLGAVSTAKLGALAVTDLPHALKDAVLLANATSLGMAGQPPLEIALDPLSADAAVADLVYTPLETPLLKAAAARGLKAVDGLGMLIHQARPGFAAWFGVDPEPDAALRAHLLESFA